jgi:hypothetical protein
MLWIILLWSGLAVSMTLGILGVLVLVYVMFGV